MESYRDLGMTNLLLQSGSMPRSSLVRQSTDPEMTLQRQSTSVSMPRCTGDAAVSANFIKQTPIACY